MTKSTVYGLFRTDPMTIEIVAPSKAGANAMRAMYGPAWHARLLTADEVATPWVQDEIAALTEAGVWA